MTINEYQKEALRTASGMNYENHGLLENAALGLCGESGEVADLVKKALFQGHKLDRGGTWQRNWVTSPGIWLSAHTRSDMTWKRSCV